MTHPITPPPELIEDWIEQFKGDHPIYIATHAAQWGADQELEACCSWVAVDSITAATELRSDRRPKPPSLKEESLKGFDTIADIVLDEYSGTTFYEQYKKLTDTIRRALEQLDD